MASFFYALRSEDHAFYCGEASFTGQDTQVLGTRDVGDAIWFDEYGPAHQQARFLSANGSKLWTVVRVERNGDVFSVMAI